MLQGDCAFFTRTFINRRVRKLTRSFAEFFFSIQEFATFGGWRWYSRRIVFESNLIVNVKQFAFGDAGKQIFSHKFHKFSQIRTRKNSVREEITNASLCLKVPSFHI